MTTRRLRDPGCVLSRAITAIAKLLKISPGTLHNHIPDLRELRTSRIPAQLDGGTR